MNREELVKRREAAMKALREIVDRCKAENRDLTTDEKSASVKASQDLKDSTEAIAKIDKSEAETKALTEFLERAEADEINGKALDGATYGPGKYRTVGERITKSAQYKALMDAHGGRISEGVKGLRMDPVNIGGLKALLTGGDRDASAGALTEPDKLGVVAYPTLPLQLRQLITVGTTNSDRVEYAQMLPAGVGDSVNNAKGVPEATDLTNGTKPRSEMAFRKAGADVITIAHWMPATKRALSDVAQLQTMIDGFLRDGIQRETERLIVSGDKDKAAAGTEEWDGILNTTGVQNVAYSGTIAETARKQITAVTNAASQVNGFIVAPDVDEAIDLAKDNTGRYYGLGPFGIGPGTLWGRPRVVVYGLPEGTIIGGDLKQCVLWDREQTTVTATDSHDDFFIKNLVAILAEARAGFGILQPSALAVSTVAAGGKGAGE